MSEFWGVLKCDGCMSHSLVHCPGRGYPPQTGHTFLLSVVVYHPLKTAAKRSFSAISWSTPALRKAERRFVAATAPKSHFYGPMCIARPAPDPQIIAADNVVRVALLLCRNCTSVVVFRWFLSRAFMSLPAGPGREWRLCVLHFVASDGSLAAKRVSCMPLPYGDHCVTRQREVPRLTCLTRYRQAEQPTGQSTEGYESLFRFPRRPNPIFAGDIAPISVRVGHT